jgi:large subunit ribosomal protein L9
MKVILLEDVPNRGVAGSFAEVKRGYARNCLIPRKMAIYNTYENREKYLKDIDPEALAMPKARVKGPAPVPHIPAEPRVKVVGTSITSIEFVKSANESGLLYGAVSIADIKQYVEDQGEVADTVEISEVIKAVGVYTVKVNEQDVQVTVVAKKAEESS